MKRLRFFALLLAFALILSLCSCNMPGRGQKPKEYTDMPRLSDQIGMHDDSDGYHIVNCVDFSYPTGYEANRTAHSYDALENDKQREIYDKILDGVYCFSDQAGYYEGEYAMRPLKFDGVNTTYNEVEFVLIAVLDDHPEIFWMATDFDLWQIKEADAVGVTLNAYYKAAEVVEMMQRLDGSLSGFFAEMPRELSEYEREEYVYRYIIENCVYDEDVSKDGYGDSHPSIYNLYGVMVDKNAVCEGYSRALDFLCSSIGVDTVCVGGVADTENDEDVDSEKSGLHMWNAVQLDNEWYWADCTWDDWDEDDDLGDVFYYLNVTDEIMFKDHTVDKTYKQITRDEYRGLDTYLNTFVPRDCTATKYCYYLREGVTLSAPDAEALSDGFVSAAEKGRKSLIVVIDHDEYTPDSFANALFEGSQPYYEALDRANEKLSGVRLDADADAVYYIDDDRKMMIFEIRYEEIIC